MFISVVVPFHNEEIHLDQVVQALLAQDYRGDRFEIIMIDDSSTDRSAEIVKKYADVRLLSSDQRGDFAARNRGISEAKGEVIAFTDADTAPSRSWLTHIARNMDAGDIDVIVGRLRFASASPYLAMIADYECEKNEFIFSGNIKEIYYGYTCNLVVRKKAFTDLGLFPAVFRNSDVVFVRRVVDEYGCDVVCFRFDVDVRRLEVSSLKAYFAKQYTYGRDFSRYGALASARPLNTRERLHVFKRTLRAKKLSPFQSLALFTLLVFGALCYEYGRLRKLPKANQQAPAVEHGRPSVESRDASSQ